MIGVLIAFIDASGEITIRRRGSILQDDVKERWRELCERVAVEEDPQEFSKLFAEVCLLLEQREAELRRGPTNPPQPESQADGVAS